MRPCSLVLFALVAASAAVAQASGQDITAAGAGQVECADSDASCYAEDDVLEISLLQTSLHLIHEEAVMQPSSSSPTVFEVYDPMHHMLDRIPLLPVGMLTFLLGLGFLVQMVGWFETAAKENDECRRPRTTILAARQDVPRATAGAFPVPQSQRILERGSFATASPASATWQATGDPPHTFGTPTSSPAQPRLSAENLARLLPICPALILPHGEAQFCIPLESIGSLIAGRYPVQILGPSGRPLLHARLPAASQDPAGSSRPGRWLELSTTPRSRYPHACVGPLPTGEPTDEVMEIRGPRGDAYGTFRWSGTDWCAKNGRCILLVVEKSQGGLSVSAPGGGRVAQASPDMDAKLVRVQVSSGVDALLALLCVMAVMVITPESAGLILYRLPADSEPQPSVAKQGCARRPSGRSAAGCTH